MTPAETANKPSAERARPERSAGIAVVPTCNRADALRDSLDSLGRAARESSLDIDIVVVDNGDGTDAEGVVDQLRLHHPDVVFRYIRQPERGVSRARNTGMAAAPNAGVIFFCDDDVHVPPGWFDAMAAPILAGEADVVAGHLRLAEELGRPWLSDYFRVRLADTSTYLAGDHPFLVSACMAVSQGAAKRLAWDDELGGGALGGGEDVLIGLQAREQGMRVVPCTEVVATHHPGASRLDRDSWLRLTARQGRSDGYIHRHWLHTDLRWTPVRAAYHWVAGWVMGTLGRLRTSTPITQCEAEHRHLAFLNWGIWVERRRSARYERRGSHKRVG